MIHLIAFFIEFKPPEIDLNLILPHNTVKYSYTDPSFKQINQLIEWGLRSQIELAEAPAFLIA